MPIIFKKGDIISDFGNNPRALILQQCNCTATKINIHSFAYSLYKKLPYSNPYSHRKSGGYENLAHVDDRPKLGSIKLTHSENYPWVCCLFAQYRMGKPNSSYCLNKKYTDQIYNETPDNSDSRLYYFKKCLKKLLRLCLDNKIDPIINKIIIPQKIGCHLAGGNWILYKKEIKIFTKKLGDNICVYVIEYNKK